MIRFWYWMCFLFLLSNTNILLEESYEVVYRMVDQNEPVQYLACKNLREISFIKTRINLNNIKKDVYYKLKWMQKNKEEDSYGKLIHNETIDKILNQFDLKNYLIYRDNICFIFSDLSDFELVSESLINLPNNPIFFVFNNETFSFLKLEYVSAKFNQITVYHQEYPYSNCYKDYSNFKCLNDKIKRRQKLSRYYYRSDENGFIELNYQINQTIIENEINVIKECNKNDCKIDLFYIDTSDIKSKPIIFKSFPYIPKLDFYLQLIGLISLFLNISNYQLIIKFLNSIHLKRLKKKFLRLKFIKLLKLKLKKSKKILIRFYFILVGLKFSRYLRSKKKFLKLLKRKYFKLDYLIFFILIICLLILFNRTISNFIDERNNPLMQSSSVDLTKSELSIVICIPINLIKRYNYDIQNRPLSQLEKDTDNGLNIVLKDIYLEFLNKKIATKWKLESKLILFRSTSRCFQIRISLNEPKYQSMFSITKLIIEFNQNKYNPPNQPSIYILTDNETFNSKSYRLDYNFRKRILKRSKSNKIKCKNYNLVDDNCLSKWNCIDQCISSKIYKKFKNLTIYSFIDKNYFKDEEWSNLFIKRVSYLKIYQIPRKECENKYSKIDPCIEKKFEQKSEIEKRLDNKREIDLYYDVINYKEEEPSIFKFLSDLLNTQSVLFGFNALKLLLIFLFKFKLNSKLIKIFKLLIYLICSIGLIAHLWFIFDEIINGQLIDSQFYEMNSTIQPPDLIFCLGFNHKKLINQNYKLSYYYLDKITKELTKDKIFKKIEYLNSSNKWIELYNRKLKDNNFEVKIFYYLNKKCFKIRQNIIYNKNHFNFNNEIEEDNGLILKILFNRTYLNDKTIHFFTKTRNRLQFSKIEELNLKDKYNSFKIRHENIKSDKFNLIRNPLLPNNEEDLNDSDKLLKKLLLHFENELNLVTLKLPFKKIDLNLNYEIDDNLFIQLYYNLEKRTNLDLNLKRQYAINYIYKENYAKFDFEFSLNLAQKVIVVTNETSSAKLIINLLNALSLWFNLCIFDLHIYLYKIKFLFLYLFNLLLKFESILHDKIFD